MLSCAEEQLSGKISEDIVVQLMIGQPIFGKFSPPSPENKLPPTLLFVGRNFVGGYANLFGRRFFGGGGEEQSHLPHGVYIRAREGVLLTRFWPRGLVLVTRRSPRQPRASSLYAFIILRFVQTRRMSSNSTLRMGPPRHTWGPVRSIPLLSDSLWLALRHIGPPRASKNVVHTHQLLGGCHVEFST